MTYDQAQQYLASFVNYEQTYQPAAMCQIKLERMQRLCRRLGDPQRAYRSVLVAGTNGKGSICSMLYSMVRETTLPVGLYTSPHLEDPRERIRVWTHGPTGHRTHGDDWISEDDWAMLVQQLFPVLEQERRVAPEGPPTYFEIITAMALVYFQRRGVELAVLEVGLGGRLDATNVVTPAVAVFGPIATDHVEVLGADPVLAAKEKAGIIKPQATVITTPQSAAVEEVLRVTCKAKAAVLIRCGHDLTVDVHHHDRDGVEATLAGLRGTYASIRIPLIGVHQADNALAAVAALESLSNTGLPHSIVEQGFARLEWVGRGEVVHEAPMVILDGAHNLHAVEALGRTLAALGAGDRVHVLLGVSSDKWSAALAQRLGALGTSVTCTKSRHPRALEPTTLAKQIRPFCRDVHVMADPADAYTYLLNASLETDVIVVTGSLFLVGELRAALRRAHVRRGRTAAKA